MPSSETRLNANAAWAVAPPEPTNLIAPWPGDEPPDLAEIGRAWAEALGSTIDAQVVAPPAPDVLDAMVVASDALPAPLAVWVEPSRGPMPGAVGDGVEATPYVIGLETQLDVDDPLGHYAALLRLLTALPARLPAVLDVNTGLWRSRPLVKRQCDDDAIEPPMDALWIVQLVGDDSAGDDAPSWLRTVGLRRCGRAELELLEVPRRLAETARTMLGEMAALLLEQPMWPAAGVALEIGPDLQVALQPAHEVAAYVTDGAPGGRRHRDADAGPAAAICATAPRGAYRPVWSWPRDVLQRLHDGDAALYRAERSVRRQIALARSTWPRLLAALSDVDDALVRAADGEAGAADPRAPGWCRVVGVEGPVVIGASLAGPTADAGPTRVSGTAVEDWIVSIGERTFGPDDVDALEAELGARR